MNYCGIDLASKTSAVCVMDGSGAVVEEFELATDEESLHRGFVGRERIRVVIEASPLAEWAASELECAGHEVVVIDPRRAKAVVCTKKKTDQLNARDLAQLSRTGWYTAVHRKSAQSRLLRSQLQARRGLVDTTVAMSARIRGLLRAHGVKLGAVSKGEFVARVRERAQAHGLWPVVAPLCQVWQLAYEQAGELEGALREQAREDALVKRLMSVPGVGVLTASAFVATIDEPRRFARSDQVPAYLGLVPSVYQSGDVEYRGRITKEGDGLLRWLLVEAAHTLLTRTRRSCALKRWGVRLLERKGHGKANVAVARKLAMVLHRVWLSGESFDWKRA